MTRPKPGTGEVVVTGRRIQVTAGPSRITGYDLHIRLHGFGALLVDRQTAVNLHAALEAALAAPATAKTPATAGAPATPARAAREGRLIHPTSIEKESNA